MSKVNISHKWIETGYDLFAKEGPEGIQVERLARILNLNKSGFYHYFGEHDVFIAELFKKHRMYADLIAEAYRKAEWFDPDFYRTLLAFKPAVLFHMQLVRYRHLKVYAEQYQVINSVVDPELIRLFATFIGIEDNPDLAYKFYEQARDMFYSRITEANLTEEFLKVLTYEVKQVVQDFLRQGSILQ